MPMYLYIKAISQEQADAAMQAHRLSADVSNKFNKSEWLCRVDSPTEATRLAVVKWFCEAPAPGPYPIGTLLFYNEGRNASASGALS